MSDSVLKHTGPISLTDTPLEPSICRTRSHHATEKFPEMKKASSSEMLKRLVAATVRGRNSLLSSTGSE